MATKKQTTHTTPGASPVPSIWLKESQAMAKKRIAQFGENDEAIVVAWLETEKRKGVKGILQIKADCLRQAREMARAAEGTEPEATEPEATKPEATEPGAIGNEPEATEPGDEGRIPISNCPLGTLVWSTSGKLIRILGAVMEPTKNGPVATGNFALAHYDMGKEMISERGAPGSTLVLPLDADEAAYEEGRIRSMTAVKVAEPKVKAPRKRDTAVNAIVAFIREGIVKGQHGAGTYEAEEDVYVVLPESGFDERIYPSARKYSTMWSNDQFTAGKATMSLGLEGYVLPGGGIRLRATDKISDALLEAIKKLPQIEPPAKAPGTRGRKVNPEKAKVALKAAAVRCAKAGITMEEVAAIIEGIEIPEKAAAQA